MLSPVHPIRIYSSTIEHPISFNAASSGGRGRCVEGRMARSQRAVGNIVR